MKILVIFAVFLSFSYSNSKIFNGNVEILEFLKGEIIKPTIKKKKLRILTHPVDKNKQIIIIPIKYRQKKDLTINYIYEGKKQSYLIDVVQKKYKKEKLSVDSSRVKPPKKVKDRIKKEYAEAMKIYGTFSPKRLWSKPFGLPIKAKVTSNYGNARIFNGSLKSFHGGTDYRAKVGTPIKASNDGVVVLSKDRYYAGGSVIIDHGQGIYTCYYHFSKLPLKVGTKVKKGDIIGYSGQSGRVTGPHLHFTVMVHGVSVDSQDFLPKINALFE